MTDLESLLACPVDKSPLQRADHVLRCANGHEFPVVEGIPVLLPPDANDTIDAMGATRVAVSSASNDDPLYLKTLGLDENERTRLRHNFERGGYEIDPVVSYMVAATCGNIYKGLVGRLPRYPIPDFRLKNGSEKLLLDLGCNWGRWCVAASREGFVPVGIDPQIGAVLAARRVAKQLGITAHFVCGDARHLPFRADVFDTVFSYSVLQHLSRNDVSDVANESRRVMKPGAESFIQMPHALGIRCLQQQIRRGFREANGFEVRYWSLAQLRVLFEKMIGPTTFEIDCFFGIGLQGSDVDMLPAGLATLVRLSEVLRQVPPLRFVADSVYVRSQNVE